MLELLASSRYPKLDGDDADRFREEGYILKVTPQRITISGASSAGIFYGAQTLRQLIHTKVEPYIFESGKNRYPTNNGQFRIPAVVITDWPAMRWRGVHDDLSRGPIPTMDYMKKQIRTLAEYKVNMFSLYMEHVFAYQKHPIAAPQEAAITRYNIRELVEYAADYHITLLPEQQAFGHLHHVLKNERYADLAELPHGHVLTPVKEGSYDLIKDMYSELVPLFPGPLFHIGADETWDLGKGQSKARKDEIGLGRMYLEHIKKVSEILKPYNKRLMFWGDIAVDYPELLNILPKDAIAVPWVYDPRPDYDKDLAPFAKAGLSLFVSPGANNWNRIVPDYNSAFVNVRNFIRDGQKYHALGALNTTWDDDGESLFEMTWPPLVFGAAASWQPGESSIEEFLGSYDWAFYRNNDEKATPFEDAIKELARTHEILRTVKINSAYDEHFFLDPFTLEGSRFTKKILPAAHELRLASENALAILYQHRSEARAHAETIDVLIFGALRIDALGMKAQFMDEISKAYGDAYANLEDRDRVGHDLEGITGMNARLEDLRDVTMRLKDLYSQRWLAENKPYWLGSVLVRYDHLGMKYQQKIEDVNIARGQWWDAHKLPAPEQMGFYPVQ